MLIFSSNAANEAHSDHQPQLSGKSKSSDNINQAAKFNSQSVRQVKSKCCMGARVVSAVLFPVKRLAENRFGLAKLLGFAIVPSQFENLCDSAYCVNKIEILCNKTFSDGRSYELAHVKDGSTELKAVICYPPGWDKQNKSKSPCVLFHNPNQCVVSDWFDFDRDDELDDDMLPGYLQRLRTCPVIIYDYSGTGLNKTSASPWPTRNTIVKDASAVLKYAVENFHNVEVAGTSLGGAVATISLEKALATDDTIKPDRVSLVSHDSFTTTARVVLPSGRKLSDALGWLVGGNLNALRPMKKLVARRVPITVINHHHDKIIPKGARMSDGVRKMTCSSDVTIIGGCDAYWNPECGRRYAHGHGQLGDEFKDALKNALDNRASR